MRKIFVLQTMGSSRQESSASSTKQKDAKTDNGSSRVHAGENQRGLPEILANPGSAHEISIQWKLSKHQHCWENREASSFKREDECEREKERKR